MVQFRMRWLLESIYQLVVQFRCVIDSLPAKDAAIHSIYNYIAMKGSCLPNRREWLLLVSTKIITKLRRKSTECFSFHFYFIYSTKFPFNFSLKMFVDKHSLIASWKTHTVNDLCKFNREKKEFHFDLLEIWRRRSHCEVCSLQVGRMTDWSKWANQPEKPWTHGNQEARFFNNNSKCNNNNNE